MSAFQPTDKKLCAPRRLHKLPPRDFADKAKRAIWQLVALFLYHPIPTRAFSIRRVVLRLFGATGANNALPYPRAIIWAPWNLTMEANSCIGEGVVCYNVSRITLGKDSIVSQGAHLCTPSHDFRDPDFPLTSAEITIGENAWVATEAFVGPGVDIGRDAVIGARAVVNKSIPAGVVVAGNPAKIVGTRQFDASANT